MRQVILQDIITIMESDPGLTGGSPIGSYPMPAEDVVDTRNIRLLFLAVRLAGAASSTTNPTLHVETSDDLVTWTSVWESAAAASASVVLTLSAGLDRGEPYRLGGYLRWRLDVPSPAGAGADPSRATFELIATIHDGGHP